MRVWINFQELRKKLRFEDVLRLHGVAINRKGDQHQGPCPLPNHGDNRKSASFSANLEKGIFQCFGCKAHGNVLEFATLMKASDPADSAALRSVAVELQQKFFPEGSGTRPKPESKKITPQPATTLVKVNEPLDFSLQSLDHSHPYLEGRGFTREIATHFGVGFCNRGWLKGRLAIPLHDMEGKTLGYAGRVIDDATITKENPKFSFPVRRERNGVVYEVKKGLFVYNGYRIRSPVDDLVVVQGFSSVWWLTQHGFPHSVALMGSDCSDEQGEIIARLTKPGGRVWLMSDGSEEDGLFASTCLERISEHRFCRWVRLDCSPTELFQNELQSRFDV